MAALNIKPADACRYDEVSLGEVMMRIDPGDVPTRIAERAGDDMAFSVRHGPVPRQRVA